MRLTTTTFPTAKEKEILKVGSSITPNNWYIYIRVDTCTHSYTYIHTHIVTFYLYVFSQGLG